MFLFLHFRFLQTLRNMLQKKFRSYSDQFESCTEFFNSYPDGKTETKLHWLRESAAFLLYFQLTYFILLLSLFLIFFLVFSLLQFILLLFLTFFVVSCVMLLTGICVLGCAFISLLKPKTAKGGCLTLEYSLPWSGQVLQFLQMLNSNSCFVLNIIGILRH